MPGARPARVRSASSTNDRPTPAAGGRGCPHRRGSGAEPGRAGRRAGRRTRGSSRRGIPTCVRGRRRPCVQPRRLRPRASAVLLPCGPAPHPAGRTLGGADLARARLRSRRGEGLRRARSDSRRRRCAARGSTEALAAHRSVARPRAVRNRVLARRCRQLPSRGDALRDRRSATRDDARPAPHDVRAGATRRGALAGRGARACGLLLSDRGVVLRDGARWHHRCIASLRAQPPRLHAARCRRLRRGEALLEVSAQRGFSGVSSASASMKAIRSVSARACSHQVAMPGRSKTACTYLREGSSSSMP